MFFKKRQKNSEKGLQEIKKAASRYIPIGSSFSAAQLKPIFNMLSDLIDAIEILTEEPLTSLERVWNDAQEAENTGGERAKAAALAALGETGYKINKFLNFLNKSYFISMVEAADNEKLVKAYAALDTYANCLKQEYKKNLEELKTLVVNELLKRNFTAEENIRPQYTPSEFEELQARCYKAVKENPNSEIAKGLVSELGKKLLTLDKIYVAYDEDFNTNFPFIGIDGRIEVCTRRYIAEALVKNYQAQHMGHLSIREFSGNNISAAVLRKYREMGIFVLHLDNGVYPIDIWFNELLDPISDNLLERQNNEERGKFLRELQYAYRVQRSDPSEKGSELERSLMGMMLTMRYNAYREFGNGLCYVFAQGSYKAGTTFYSEKALAKAKEMLKENNLPESALIAEGDKDFAVYNSTISLLTAVKSNKTMVCAFTGRKEAEAARMGFLKYGRDCSVIIITYDELYPHAAQCDGIVIDMPTYGLEIPKNEFEDVDKWRAVSGMILINIKE